MSGRPRGDPRYILLDAHRIGNKAFGLLVASLPSIGQLEDTCGAVNQIETQLSLERADAS